MKLQYMHLWRREDSFKDPRKKRQLKKRNEAKFYRMKKKKKHFRDIRCEKNGTAHARTPPDPLPLENLNKAIDFLRNISMDSVMSSSAR